MQDNEVNNWVQSEGIHLPTSGKKVISNFILFLLKCNESKNNIECEQLIVFYKENKYIELVISKFSFEFE